MRINTWSLVAVIVWSVACGGATKKPAPPPAVVTEEPGPTAPIAVGDTEPTLPALPDAPVAAPASVLATGVIASPAATIAAVAALADVVQPGAGAMINVDLLVQLAAQHGVDLAGADPRRPVRLVVLDPNQFRAPIVMVVGVGDQAALEAAAEQHGARIQVRDGFAAIGTFDTLSEAGGYALTTLLATPAPAHPTVAVNVRAVMDRYGPMLQAMAQQIAQMGDPSKVASATMMLDMYMSLFAQIDRVDLALELGTDRATVMTRLHPVAGSALATFIGKQTPSRFGLLGQLPAGAVVLGGRLELGQIWDAVLPAIAQTLAASDTPRGAAVMAAYQAWIALESGEHAIAVVGPGAGLGVAGLWEVAQPAQALKAWTGYMNASFGDVSPGSAIAKRTVSHRGSKVSVVTAKPGPNVTTDHREMFDMFGGALGYGLGVVDKRLVFALAADPGPHAKALIDVSKDGPKKAPTAHQVARAPVLDEARRRGESYLVAFDVAALAAARSGAMLGNGPGPSTAVPAEPAAFAISAADGALTWRLTVPAAQVKLVLAM